MTKLCAFAVALLAVVLAPPTRAQEQQSFKTIMGKGYEIKTVTFARGEATDNRRDLRGHPCRRRSRSQSATSPPPTGST